MVKEPEVTLTCPHPGQKASVFPIPRYDKEWPHAPFSSVALVNGVLHPHSAGAGGSSTAKTDILQHVGRWIERWSDRWARNV